MRRSCFAALLLAPLIAGSAASQRNGASFPLNIVAAATFGEDAGFTTIVSAAIGPTGTLFAADYVTCRVAAFSPEGRMLWKVGRKGHGPGEYQVPYRLTATPEGTVLVFDIGTGEVTTLGSDGRFLSRTMLPLRFAAMDAMVAGAGDLLISGVTTTPGQGRRHGVHRFRRTVASLAYVGSFGPLPTARDTAVLPFWGAGHIARATNGDLLYALNLPYVIYRFDSVGRQRGAVRSPIRVRGSPDDAIRIERHDGGTLISDTNAPVDRLATVVEVANGSVLVSRITARARYWDLFSAAGGLIGSREIPREWGTTVTFDRVRNLLWMVSTHDDDAPVLVRLQLASGAPTSSRRVR